MANFFTKVNVENKVFYVLKQTLFFYHQTLVKKVNRGKLTLLPY